LCKRIDRGFFLEGGIENVAEDMYCSWRDMLRGSVLGTSFCGHFTVLMHDAL
jgi:hypothetical protein